MGDGSGGSRGKREPAVRPHGLFCRFLKKHLKGTSVDYHGTITGYVNKRCRCDECRKAHSDYYHGVRRQRAQQVPDDMHGRNSTYISYMCRCKECRDAHAAYQRQYRKKAATR